MIQKIHIDLDTVANRDDLFRIVASIFLFPDYFGNNWDALFDMMYSLHPETLSRISGTTDSITGVHLIFLSFDTFEAQFPEADMIQFCRILVDLSANREYR